MTSPPFCVNKYPLGTWRHLRLCFYIKCTQVRTAPKTLQGYLPTVNEILSEYRDLKLRVMHVFFSCHSRFHQRSVESVF